MGRTAPLRAETIAGEIETATGQTALPAAPLATLPAIGGGLGVTG